MNLQELLDALQATCEGKSEADHVEIPVQVLLSANNELKGQAQLHKDLEQARDEANMRPSVARKLNEKIRALEAELEQLRTNKKVKELEKKVQFLSEELKQSYTTKNFTLKSGLLDLEKQYRAHMNQDPAMAAFWADVTVLLDENRDKDAPLKFTGPPTAAAATAARPSSSSGVTTAARRSSTGSQLDAATAAAAGSQNVSASDPGQQQQQQDMTIANSNAPAASSGPPLSGDGSSSSHSNVVLPNRAASGVQLHVSSFDHKIKEEAASAATALHDGGSSGSGVHGDMVIRQGAGFRIIRASAPGDAAAAAAGAASAVVEERLQPVQVLKDSYASRIKEVTFKALSADLGSKATAAAAAAAVDGVQKQQSVPQPVDVHAADRQVDSICASVAVLQQLLSSMASTAEQDSSSELQEQMQQLTTAVQQLKPVSSADAVAAKPYTEQQGATAAAVLASVQQLQEAVGSSNSSDASAVVQQLAAVQHEVQQLQLLQYQAAKQADSQKLLLQVFGEFLQQLEQQGVIVPAAAVQGQQHNQQQQQQQQHVLLELLQGFLAVNPQVPQLIADQAVAPTAAANKESGSVESMQGLLDHPVVQAEPQTAPEEVSSAHAATQSEPLSSPSVHASTQADAAAVNQSTVAVQTAPAEQASAASQTAAAAADQSGTAVQTAPAEQATAAVQVEPQLAHAASQADVQLDQPAAVDAVAPAEGTAGAEGTVEESAAVLPDTEGSTAAGMFAPAEWQVKAAAADDNDAADHQPTSGSGVIYSGSGAELSASKAAVGQQLDLLDELQRRKTPDSAAPAEIEPANSNVAAETQPAPVSEAANHQPNVTDVIAVQPEELNDIQAVAKELSKLRADNLELAANLNVTQSLVEHLNSTMKEAIDKADDAEAEAAQTKKQLSEASAALQQLQSEQAELTRVLIEAKVEIAEKKGQLLALVRNLRRAVDNPATPANMVKELQSILANAAETADGLEPAPASREPSSRGLAGVTSAREAMASFTAGLGQAFGSGSSRVLRRQSADVGGVPVANATESSSRRQSDG